MSSSVCLVSPIQDLLQISRGKDGRGDAPGRSLLSSDGGPTVLHVDRWVSGDVFRSDGSLEANRWD